MNNISVALLDIQTGRFDLEETRKRGLDKVFIFPSEEPGDVSDLADPLWYSVKTAIDVGFEYPDPSIPFKSQVITFTERTPIAEIWIEPSYAAASRIYSLTLHIRSRSLRSAAGAFYRLITDWKLTQDFGKT